MLNYIFAEFYRITHKKTTYLYFGLLFLAYGVLCLAVKLTGNGFNFNEYVNFSVVMLGAFFIFFVGIPVLLTLYIDDLSSRTFGNIIGSGLSRVSLVLAKLIVAIVFLFAVFVVSGLAFVAFSFLFFGQTISGDMVKTIVSLAIAVYLQILAMISISSVLVYWTQKGALVTTSFVILASGMIPGIISLLSPLNKIFIDIYNLLLSVKVSAFLNAGGVRSVPSALILTALVYVVITTVCSITIVARNEIKAD